MAALCSLHKETFFNYSVFQNSEIEVDSMNLGINLTIYYNEKICQKQQKEIYQNYSAVLFLFV